jgi:hypothetical protein
MNGLDTVSIENVSLSVVTGEPIEWKPNNPGSYGWNQCSQIPSLPKGLTFNDAGQLSGTVSFDWQEEAEYVRKFVALSTTQWKKEGSIGKIEIIFKVTRNIAPPGFDEAAEDRRFAKGRQAARTAASNAFSVYQQYEQQKVTHDRTVDQMKLHLSALRNILEIQPHLEGGMLWGWLGGLHMNVHKLMENMLLECEAYLGAALLFPSDEVRQFAAQNLEGCYSKRQLEAAKFIWLEGLERVSQEDWAGARGALERAAQKKEGWGWGVNNGDIWMALGAVQLVQWAESQQQQQLQGDQAALVGLEEARSTLMKAKNRRDDHPWTLSNLQAADRFEAAAATDLQQLLVEFVHETKSWCADVMPHVQPKPRPAKLPRTPWSGQ